MTFTGAEILVHLLERAGISIVAGIPGGSILPVYHALARSSITHVLARHEQGAAFIAGGMARSTGMPGVCLATSGPGATNLLTGVADAKADSVPLVVITGQVSSHLRGTDAFQEVDTAAIFGSCVKKIYTVSTPQDLLSVVPHAFACAISGKPGPVLIDIPRDVQTSVTQVDEWPDCIIPYNGPPDRTSIDMMAEMIESSVRPLLFIGGGVTASGSYMEVRELSHRCSIPVISTLMGLGCMDSRDPLFIGMTGMHGNPASNLAPAEADLVIALGVRFDDRAVCDPLRFCPEAKIIHVDIDPALPAKRIRADLAITADIRDVLVRLNDRITPAEHATWMERIRSFQKIDYPAKGMDDYINPGDMLRLVGSIADEDSIIVTDVGQHQMWTAQHYPFSLPRTCITSGGLGTMGFGLPSAIGAALANPGRKVVCVTGDGSIMMNLQELATLRELGCDLLILVFNNGHLGMVRQQQELFFNREYFASRFTINPDFASVARCFAIQGHTLFPGDDPRSMLMKSLKFRGPLLLDIPVNPGLNVYPMVQPGMANTDMIHGRMTRNAEIQGVSGKME